MVKSVKEIVDMCKKGEEPDVETKMEAMASILDYQKNKEEVRFWGGGKERFDQSMELAMSLCGGTGAEVYLTTQINKVNEIRRLSGDSEMVNKEQITNQKLALGQADGQAAHREGPRQEGPGINL